jgi:glycosyltransferase involved in cell wall biosynthesis
MLELVFRDTRSFDIMHFHIDYLHFPLTRRQPIAAVTTLHGRLDLAGLPSVYREFHDMNLVSVSDAQRAPVPWANWIATVHHGLRNDCYTPHTEPGKYLAFLGRICPEKRADRAIRIAQKVGIPLKIAAKVDAVDQEYFESRIKHLLRDPLVEYIGEIGEEHKNDFLGNAVALLFPIDWPEPFGLVMVEAMACGTPTIAWAMGSAPEILDDHKTGFIVNSEEEAVTAVNRLSSLDRKMSRDIFEKRFGAQRMCSDYLSIYNKLIGSSKRAEVKPLERFALTRLDIQKSRLKQMVDDGTGPIQPVDSGLKTGFGDSADLR